MTPLAKEIRVLQRRKSELEMALRLRSEVEVLELRLTANALTDDRCAWRVVESVCRDIGIAPAEVFTRTRTARLVLGRAVIFKALREYGRMTFESIGKLSGRTHGAIMHSISSLDRLCLVDREIAKRSNSALAAARQTILEFQQDQQPSVNNEKANENRTTKDRSNPQRNCHHLR